MSRERSKNRQNGRRTYDSSDSLDVPAICDYSYENLMRGSSRERGLRGWRGAVDP